MANDVIFRDGMRETGGNLSYRLKPEADDSSPSECTWRMDTDRRFRD